MSGGGGDLVAKQNLSRDVGHTTLSSLVRFFSVSTGQTFALIGIPLGTPGTLSFASKVINFKFLDKFALGFAYFTF